MDAKLIHVSKIMLLLAGVMTLILSILLFGSFSIYLSRSMEKLFSALSDGSAFLYLIAFGGLLAGMGMAIAGGLLLASESSKLRNKIERPFRKTTEQPAEEKFSSIKHAIYIELWALPFMAVFSALGVQVAIVGVLYSRLVGLMAAGFLVLILGALVILFRGLLQSRSVRVGFFFINVALLAFLTVLVWLAAFAGYRLVWGFTAWETGFGIFVLYKEKRRPLNHDWKQRVMAWGSDHFSRRQYKIIASYMMMAALFAGPGALLMTAPAWNCQTFQFTITPQQAQQTDLVMYYTSGFATHHYVVDIAKEFNVTLTLVWDPSYYYNSTNGTPGYDMMQFIKYANARGVPIEMFGTYYGFHWEDLLAGVVNEGTWTHFKSWLVTNGITVQYVLWDIEDSSRPSDIANMSAFFPIVEVRGLAQRYRELPAVRAQFEHLVAETAAMGVKTRITTFGPGDAFDGNADLTLLSGFASYDMPDLIANGSIEYVSTMAYTNHWGDISPENMSGYESVYDNARQLRRLMPDHVAVDIGNINGAGETKIDEVVNQVNLAIAGGATSVRLFNGASWVNGWNYVENGPEWGYNGTRALFTAIRQGGIARFTENTSINTGSFQGLFLDCVVNIMKL